MIVLIAFRLFFKFLLSFQFGQHSCPNGVLIAFRLFFKFLPDTRYLTFVLDIDVVLIAFRLFFKFLPLQFGQHSCPNGKQCLNRLSALF